MRDGSYVIVDRLCEATTQLLEIIKKQEEIIEQCRISDELHKELDDMKNDVDQKMDLIEYDLRSYRRSVKNDRFYREILDRVSFWIDNQWNGRDGEADVQSALKNKAIDKGVEALLRNGIVQTYNKWSERGYCPIYARENATRMYEPYHILGGNDVATDLIEDLKGLPTEPQKKKEGVEDDT